MRINYVLVDFENVQPTAVDSLNRDYIKVIIFVGANQTKIPLAIAISLQQLGCRAEYMQISGSGTNALDFHISYTIGRIAASDPHAYFHIISKDTGFDPLITHLKSQKVYARRSVCIDEIPFVKMSKAISLSERALLVQQDLHKRGTSRPCSLISLTRTIDALF